MVDKIYTIPLRDAYNARRPNRAKKAVKIIRKFLARHTKSKAVKLDPSLNEILWDRGIEKPPRRVKLKVAEVEGKLTASLIE